jgi:HEAT repeat protein
MGFGIKRKIKQLRSDKPEVRAEAICALAELGDVQAVKPLCAVLNDEQRPLRIAAAQALGAIGHASAIGPLIDSLLRESSWDVRHEAVEALRKIGDPQAINNLVLILESDRDEGAREFAAWALKEFGWEQLTPTQQATVAIMQDDWATTARLGEAAITPVCAALNSGTPHVRRHAAEALAAIASDRAVAALVAGLESDERDLQVTCAGVLEKQVWTNLEPRHLARVAVILNKWPIAISAGATAIEPLMQAFHESDRYTQEQIIDVLAQIDGPRAAEALLIAARVEQDAVRCAALTALAGLRAPETVEVLAGALSAPLPEVRRAVAAALTRLGWEPADEGERVQLAIAAGDAQTLTALGDRALTGLLQSLRTPNARASAVNLLAEFGEKAIDPLLAMLAEQADDLRACAAQALAAIGISRVRPQVDALLGDPSLNVRQAAAAALPRLGWQPADDGDRARVAVACEDWDAAIALGEYAVAPLLAATQEKTARPAALKALEQALDNEALARMTADDLNTVIKQTESLARPGSTRLLTAGPQLKQAVICRRIAQRVRTELQRRPQG